MRKLSKTLLSLLLIAAMLASFVVLPAAAEEPAAEQPTEAVQAAETQADDAVKTNYELSIVMLDCGRKYFSVDSIKQIIDNASAAGFGYIMLGVGNDGMRFLLDDMSLTVNGMTYESDAVKTAIHAGNEAYYNFAVDELTQSEMDAVLAYAKEKGMGVIPMLNTPGHMDAILAAATSLTGTNCSYNGSARTIDVTNSTAVAFTQAFVQKYVDYFASKGCKYFNMGADEYANDMFTGGSMGFGNLQSEGKYSYYVTYVNDVAAMIKNAGMTPMAFNDGIYFANNTSSGTFDTDIVICYWSNGWGSYSPMSASNLANKGFKMVNTNGSYYWVLGKPDAQCSASKAKDFDIKSFPGSTINNPSGAMFCIWADYPGAETEASVISKTADTIAAFGATLPKIDDNKTVSDEATGVSVTAPGLTGITVAAVDKGTELDGKKVAGAWNIELTTENGSYTDSATVSIPVGKEWLSYKLTGGVLESDGTTVTSDPNSKVENGVLTFTAKHFSTVVVLAEEKQQEITVTVGGTEPITVDGEVSSAYTDDFVTVKTETKNMTATPYYERAALDEGEFYLSNNANDTAPSVKVTLAAMGNGQYSLFSNAYYRYPDATYNTFIIGFGYWSYDDARDRSPVGLTISESETGAVTISREVTSGSHKTTSWLTLSSGSFDASENSTMLYLYKLVQPTASKQTTISFTGKKAGTTQVLIGDTLYTVRVVDKAPDGAMTASSLKIEYWITNAKVYEGKNDSTNPYYLLQSTDAVSDDGVAVQDVALKVGYSPFDNYTAEMYYWQAMRLDANNIQTGSEGDDETADGTTFTHVRYHAGAWQYKTLDGTWHYFLSTDQAVAYYLQKTKVTTEVDTYVKDWGYGTAGTTPNTSGGMGQVALTVAVVYPDGTVSPAEKNMYFKSTTIFNYWADRDIGIIAPKNNEDYTISKITVTDGNRKSNSSANVWYTSDTITWEKTTLDDGVTKWYNEREVWNKSSGTTPMVNGKNSKETWSAKNTAKLVLIYLEAAEKESNLNVVYYDDTYSKEIISSQIVMSYTQGQEPPTYLNSLKNNSTVTTGTITLADEAYVTNSSGVNQTFNKNVATVPGVAAQYRSGLYKYVSAEISEDGKTLTLHYKISASNLKKYYVVDFGLPVQFELTDLVDDTNLSKVRISTVTDGNVTYDETTKTFTYTPTEVLKSLATASIAISYTGKEEAILTVGFIPASTVYYEEGFASYSANWVSEGTAHGARQAKEPYGQATNSYGFDPAYRENSANSEGTVARTTTVGSDATFKFNGTGLELYLRTKNTSVNAEDVTNHSYMLVQVYEGSEATTDHLKRMSFVDVNNLFVAKDTGYGYNTPCWTVDDMALNDYTVVVRFVKGQELAIDGFRVTGTQGDRYKNAYAADGEANMQTAEIRNMVLAQANVYALADNWYKVGSEVIDAVFDKEDAARISGAVLIKKNYNESTGGTEVTVDKDLVNIGPKNEIYLKQGEAVVMQLTGSYASVQVGMRSLTGEAVSYKINGTSATMKSTVDMYYKVDLVDKKLVIQNVSGGILALTRLKVTSATAATTNDPGVVPQTTPEAIRYAMALMRGIDVPQFTDVAEDAWYHDYVYDLVYRGVVNGMTATTYEPEGKLTRAQFVKLLACSLEEAETLKTYEGQHPFTDSEGHWAEAYIAWAKDKGIVEGVSATEFDPEAPITREQMATIFGRYALKQGIVLPKDAAPAESFPDADKISEYAREFVELMRIAGILNGYEDGTFRPQGNATRAEAAKLFSLFLSITDKLAK